MSNNNDLHQAIDLYIDILALMEQIRKNQALLKAKPDYKLFLSTQKLNQEYYQLREEFGKLTTNHITKVSYLQAKKDKRDLTGDIIGPFLVLRRVTREEEKVVERLNIPWKQLSTQFQRKAIEDGTVIPAVPQNLQRKDGRSTYNPKIRSSRWEVEDLRTGKIKIKTKRDLKRLYDTSKSLKWVEVGNLKVVGTEGEYRNGKLMWYCRCKCGQYVWRTDLSLRQRSVKDCGQWCSLNKGVRLRIRKALEKDIKSKVYKDVWFKNEYARIQKSPRVLDEYIDQLCLQKAAEALDKGATNPQTPQQIVQEVKDRVRYRQRKETYLESQKTTKKRKRKKKGKVVKKVEPGSQPNALDALFDEVLGDDKIK